MRLVAKGAWSLATSGVGERVTVEHILFDVVRSRCAAAGVVAGVVLEVTASTPEYVHVRTARGTTVSLERTLARFVGVVAPPPTAVQGELAVALSPREAAAVAAPRGSVVAAA